MLCYYALFSTCFVGSSVLFAFLTTKSAKHKSFFSKCTFFFANMATMNRACVTPPCPTRGFPPTIGVVLALIVTMQLPGWGAQYSSAKLNPPPINREFRAAWIATVSNIDWPSTNRLSTAAQQRELLAMLDAASNLGLNAAIFQVRPACDALYASRLEPWSEYLTGTMGQAPVPYYDPLAFVIAEAHKRRLELHAWFNPYRARHPSARGPVSANHISKTRPELVRSYGRHLWLDPGEKAVQDYSLGVVMDVLKRYDVDGIHFDDYFYPYKERDASGKELDFPDDPSWRKYGGGGKNRDDWRRENVNVFVQRVYRAIKAEKPWVKFGISPFGIWRPGYPAQIRGLDAYAHLYADARTWWTNGWVDYFAPQLYWAIEPPAQSFPALLNWWSEQNTQQRHLWPGMNSVNVGRTWKPEEIINQVRLTGGASPTSGHIHWNMRRGLMSKNGLAEALRAQLYREPALVPASPWLASNAPAKPKLTVTSRKDGTRVAWPPASGAGASQIAFWVLQTRTQGRWTTEVLAGSTTSHLLSGSPEQVALRAVDRYGQLSALSGAARKSR
jgi:uncharacterized lipoprotein YddW (UPF0748 family)